MLFRESGPSAVALLAVLLLASCAGPTPVVVEDSDLAVRPDCVIVLHGLGRSNRSMDKMAEALTAAGYRVYNELYPSREKTIEELSMDAVPAGLSWCAVGPGEKVHFVTHSMGGIMLRFYLEQESIPALGRVVMLSPPNQGSELVDRLSGWPGFGLVAGVAGYQLGTGPESLPLKLGPADFEVGIIAGNRSFNPVYSSLVDGEDDGKVAPDEARLEGMSDFLVVPSSHSFIMNSDEVIAQSLHFLEHGKFMRGESAEDSDTPPDARSYTGPTGS